MSPSRRRPAGAARQSVRIIAGRWRGRRLDFPPATAVRPTPDRVRETLFNWLMPQLPGARVLDLYAGTGALGLEALSRGAAAAVFVERDPALVRALQANAARLEAPATIVAADVPAWLRQADGLFDLVLLDPPFAEQPSGPLLATLQARGLLAPGGMVYLEAGQAQAPPVGYLPWRSGRAGRVRYHLWRQAGAGGA